jgi:hypothetical protein
MRADPEKVRLSRIGVDNFEGIENGSNAYAKLLLIHTTRLPSNTAEGLEEA